MRCMHCKLCNGIYGKTKYYSLTLAADLVQLKTILIILRSTREVSTFLRPLKGRNFFHMP